MNFSAIPFRSLNRLPISTFSFPQQMTTQKIDGIWHSKANGNFHIRSNTFSTKTKEDEEMNANAILEQHFDYKIQKQMTSDDVEDGIFRVLGRFIKTNKINNEHIEEAFKKRRLKFDIKMLKSYECESFVEQLENEFGFEFYREYFTKRRFISGCDLHDYICNEFSIDKRFEQKDWLKREPKWAKDEDLKKKWPY